MQRQIYPLLLLMMLALAVVVCLRPSAAKELLTLAGTWTGELPRRVLAEPSTAPERSRREELIPPYRSVPVTRWESGPRATTYEVSRTTGEAFASDIPGELGFGPPPLPSPKNQLPAEQPGPTGMQRPTRPSADSSGTPTSLGREPSRHPIGRDAPPAKRWPWQPLVDRLRSGTGFGQTPRSLNDQGYPQASNQAYPPQPTEQEYSQPIPPRHPQQFNHGYPQPPDRPETWDDQPPAGRPTRRVVAPEPPLEPGRAGQGAFPGNSTPLGSPVRVDPSAYPVYPSTGTPSDRAYPRSTPDARFPRYRDPGPPRVESKPNGLNPTDLNPNGLNPDGLPGSPPSGRQAGDYRRPDAPGNDEKRRFVDLPRPPDRRMSPPRSTQPSGSLSKNATIPNGRPGSSAASTQETRSMGSFRSTAPTHQPVFQPAVRAPQRDRNPPREARSNVTSRAAGGATPCEGAQILARVGSEVILACEVLPAVNELLQQNKDTIPPSQLEAQRKLWMQRFLAKRVEEKLLYADAKRNIPPEGLANIEQQLAEQFEKDELPKKLKNAKLSSRRQLDEKLQQLGSSLERAKRTFIEQAIAQSWVYQQVKSNEEITHDDLLTYYREHLADYDHPARARWEQLTVRFSKHPNKSQAWAAIARMGNEVMKGRPFGEVAKEDSHGVTASKGGVYDWTTKGSLVSEVLDEAIFGLSEGRLSQILEDDEGLHIVRVIERDQGGQTPFLEAQVVIKEKIRLARKRERMEVYSNRLREQIRVWTMFDEEIAENRASDGVGSPLR